RSGSPDDLSSAAGTQMMSFLASSTVDLDELRSFDGVHAVRQDGPRIVIEGDDGMPQAVLGRLSDHGVTARSVSITTPTLEDAYLAATREDR
ncbi:MAG TPA: ABC transporter ATP-binding protein, partial [Brevibacterium sp.]|nr:ABC transporter ATP-binding protein [Brevibacterium sp.]